MALIRGREVKAGPKQLPANPKLWNMVTTQALAKFSKKSPARSNWIHSKYLQMGGRFVNSKSEIDPRFRDYVQEKRDKEEAAAKAKIKKPIL